MNLDFINLNRMPIIVDVGANPIDGRPPYKPLLEQDGCVVIGFEPQPEAYKRLQSQKSDSEIYVNAALGDGDVHRLYLTKADGMASFYQPNADVLSHLKDFADHGEIVGALDVETLPLDAIDEIEDLDFLKMDIQGAELFVLNHGKSKLEMACVVQLEVPFIELYHDQPTFAEVDYFMRSQGFMVHTFQSTKKWSVLGNDGLSIAGIPQNQLLEADIVYIRPFATFKSMDTEKLKCMAVIMHHCFQSFDISAKILTELGERDSLGMEEVNQYRSWIGNLIK